MAGRRLSSDLDPTDQRHIHVAERLVEGERKGKMIDEVPRVVPDLRGCTTVAVTQTEPPTVAVPCVSDVLNRLDDAMFPGVPLEWFKDLFIGCRRCKKVTTRRTFEKHICD